MRFVIKLFGATNPALFAAIFVLTLSFILLVAPAASGDEGPGIHPALSGVLHTDSDLEISGSVNIAGDTYSKGNTMVYGPATIDGRGYASGSIAWDSISSPYLGMPYPGSEIRTFPTVDFEYYKSLAEAQGKFFLGNLHLTKANQQLGLIFVEGNLKVSSGLQGVTAVVTGDIRVTGNPELRASVDSLLVVAKGAIDVSGNPLLSGIVYSEKTVAVNGSPALAGVVVAKGNLKLSGDVTARDTIAPEPPVLDQPVSPTNRRAVTVSGQAEPNSFIEIIEGVQVVSTASVDAAGRFSAQLDLSEGAHSLIAVAQDSAGNVSEPSFSRSVTVDLTPPDTVFVRPAAGASLNGLVTLEATAADNFGVEKCEFYINNQLLASAGVPPYEATWDTALYDNGNYQLKILAYDVAGNVGQSEITVEVANNIITPLGGTLTSPDGLVTLAFPPGAVSEPVRVKYAEIPETTPPGFSFAGDFFDLKGETLDGRPVNLFSQAFVLTVNDVPNTPHLGLYFYDANQNRWRLVSPAAISEGKLTAVLDSFALFALLADTEPPATAASLSTEAGPSGWHREPTTVTLAAADSGSGVSGTYWQWDTTTGPWQSYTNAIEAAQEGSHRLYYFSLDASGNREEVKSTPVNIDTAAPTSGITSPAKNNVVSGTTVVSAVADDPGSGVDKVTFYINDQAAGESTAFPYRLNWDTTKEINGPSSLFVVATDRVGRTAASSPVRIEVDNPAPFTPAAGIRDWLLLGPFDRPDSSTGLEKDYLGGENLARPTVGDSETLGISSPTDTIDLTSHLGDTTEVAVYANVYVNSPVSQTARLYLGSTGAFKVWLNGQLVLVGTTSSAGESSAVVSLVKGHNQLLVKTTNGASTDYKFSVKVADSNGGEIPSLAYRLENPYTDVLLEDNFNQTDATPSSIWQALTTTTVEANRLKSGGRWLSADNLPQSDYLITQDVMFEPNRSKTVSSYIMFRAVDINNGYELGITDSGRFAFYRKINGIRTQIGPSVNLPIEFGQAYRLEIKAKGNTFVALLDNVTLLKITDTEGAFPGPGKIGAENSTVAHHDNIKVAVPGPDPWTIKGKVTNRTGDPIPGLTVAASTKPDAEANVNEYAGITATDGSYVIEAADLTKTTDLSVFADSQSYSAGESDITLPAANPEQTVDLILNDTGALTGRIVDSSGSPIAGATALGFSPDFIASGEATLTNANGIFVLNNLDAPGNYNITADAFGYSSKQLETTYAVSPDATATAGDFTLTPAGKISGRVVDPYGNPMPGAFVSARLADSEEAKNATTAPDGRFVVQDVDPAGGYEGEAMADGYESSLKSDITVVSGQITEDINFVLGIKPAYVARLYGDRKDYTEDYIFPPNADEPAAGVYRKDTKYNQAYYPRWDTHQWITRRAVEILKNDGFGNLVDKLGQRANGHTLWYWIARGARRADMSYEKESGFSVDHIHNPTYHTGSYSILSPISAADYAQAAFNQALAVWQAGEKDKAMYLLGLALHNVQDLRVPQHTRPMPVRFDNHIEYESWVEDNKTNPDMVASNGTITQDDFKASGFNHTNPETAFGWVDQSAHVAERYYDQAAGPIAEGGWDPPATAPLFRSAQRFSAGFIKFFFDQVQISRSLKAQISWDQAIEPNPKLFNPSPMWQPADLSNPFPDWGLPGVTFDNPVITSSLDGQQIYLEKPYETGAYLADADLAGIVNKGIVHGTAKVFIDNVLVDTIKSPAIDTNQGNVYWNDGSNNFTHWSSTALPNVVAGKEFVATNSSGYSFHHWIVGVSKSYMSGRFYYYIQVKRQGAWGTEYDTSGYISQTDNLENKFYFFVRTDSSEIYLMAKDSGRWAVNGSPRWRFTSPPTVDMASIKGNDFSGIDPETYKKPYWQIYTVDEPEGEGKVVNEVSYR